MFYEVIFCAASGQIENCHFLLMSRFSTAIAKIFFLKQIRSGLRLSRADPGALCHRGFSEITMGSHYNLYTEERLL